MKNYKETSAEILRLIGGKENVSHVEHCTTRLRFTLVDPKQADLTALKKVPNVMGVIASGAQCQVVIGSDVLEAYNELIKLADFNTGNTPQPAASVKKNIGALLLDYMVGIFQPLIPAIAGAGVLKATLTLLTTTGVLSPAGTAYQVFYTIADAPLYYLGVLVAFTAAAKFGSNRLTAVSLALAMVHPSFSALMGSGDARFLGLTIQNLSYANQVFPSILIVLCMSFVEKAGNAWCPKAIRTFFVPLLCFAICFPAGILVLGPLGYNMGSLLSAAVLSLYTSFGWLAVALVAAILPFMVSLGMHKALVPYAVASIADRPGFDMLYLPASLAHNISEGGACLAVALKTKDTVLRATAISAGISGLFGITEPALYGITLQRRRVLVSVIASSCIGGLCIGLMGVKAFASVGPGIASMAMYIDPDNGMNFIYACAGFALSLALSFILTLFLYQDEGANQDVPNKANQADKSLRDGKANKSDKADKSPISIASPLSGTAIPLEEVGDELVSQKVLGDGIAVIPDKREVYAPANAMIEKVFDSGHAMLMRTEEGALILIHIGIQTARLEGRGFSPLAAAGDLVKKGDLLLRFDIEAIKKAGYDITSPIILTNETDFFIRERITGRTAPGTTLITLEDAQ